VAAWAARAAASAAPRGGLGGGGGRSNAAAAGFAGLGDGAAGVGGRATAGCARVAAGEAFGATTDSARCVTASVDTSVGSSALAACGAREGFGGGRGWSASRTGGFAATSESVSALGAVLNAARCDGDKGGLDARTVVSITRTGWAESAGAGSAAGAAPSPRTSDLGLGGGLSRLDMLGGSTAANSWPKSALRSGGASSPSSGTSGGASSARSSAKSRFSMVMRPSPEPRRSAPCRGRE
jgi:hypothetical protein